MASVTDESLSLKQILKTWWPLAASWLLMGIEGPALSAVMARLAEPEINLAAYGGVVFPLCLIIEAPIIMLLAASTALSKNCDSYRWLHRFMMISGAILTAIHVFVAFTPIYYLVVRNWLAVPEEIVQPARIGLMIMTPWTWSIAYRRFQQGVMIRFGHSRAVGIGTMVRLLSGGTVLLVGYWLNAVAGIVVACTAQALGVVSEAIYAGFRVRPILKYQVRYLTSADPITWRLFTGFYLPLAMTSVLSLVWQPIGSAALSRMDKPLESLAVWPVLSGLVFMLRTFGMAYNEVVVALLERAGAYWKLRQFSMLLLLGSTLLHLCIAATPLSTLWFASVSALPPSLVEIARTGFWTALPIAPLTVLQSWYQGAIVAGKKTRGISEAMAIFLMVVLSVMIAGVMWFDIIGLYVGMTAFSIANLAQTLWLWFRSRPVLQEMKVRDRSFLALSID